MQAIEYDYINDVLYAGNDLGLYYFNGTSWNSISSLPKTIISDLKINRSTGELYVATYGRGIWKGYLWNYNCQTGTYLPGTSVNWSTPQVLLKDYTIENGDICKLSSTLYSPCKKTIRVNSGGKLEVDGGRIQYAKIIIEAGGTLEVKNHGIIDLDSPLNLDVQTGGILSLTDGEIRSVKGDYIRICRGFHPEKGMESPIYLVKSHQRDYHQWQF